MNRTTSVPMWGLAFLTGTLGCTAASRAPTIEGSWVVARATLGGKDLPVESFENSVLRLAGGTYVFQNDTGEYALLPGTAPAALDVRGLQGPNAGRTIPAIVKQQGDTLTICYDLSGKVRPTDFISDSGTQVFLVRYARMAP